MRAALAGLCLALAGCSTTQIYPTLQEQRISLSPGNLEAAGLVFITPDGSIAWEGVQEMRVSEDTTTEEPVMQRMVLERTARDLIARLP